MTHPHRMPVNFFNSPLDPAGHSSTSDPNPLDHPATKGVLCGVAMTCFLVGLPANLVALGYFTRSYRRTISGLGADADGASKSRGGRWIRGSHYSLVTTLTLPLPQHMSIGFTS